MPRTDRRFQRPFGERRYRKLFIIAAEGAITEPLYFGLFNNQQAVIKVQCLKSSHDSAPKHVLKRMKKYLQNESLQATDEAWLVVDKDQWTDEQLTRLHAWAQERENFGFALSNPKFEYWLLLHFEDGSRITSSSKCTERLQRHLPDYDKGFDIRKFTPSMIDDAIRRAHWRDTPPCADWPRSIGATTVYRLVENILHH